MENNVQNHLLVRSGSKRGIMIYMRDFNRNNNSGRGRGFGEKRQFSNRGFDGPRTMYPATCANCGKACEVPFRPTGDKPVFCRDCFRENGGESRRPEERNFSRPQNAPVPNNEYKAQLDALSVKVDKILDILTAATSADKIQTEEILEVAEVPTTEKKKRTTKKTV